MHNTTTKTIPAIASKEKIGAVLAILLGSLFIYIVGFANVEIMHNAAHDTRHSNAFPCH